MFLIWKSLPELQFLISCVTWAATWWQENVANEEDKTEPACVHVSSTSFVIAHARAFVTSVPACGIYTMATVLPLSQRLIE